MKKLQLSDPPRFLTHHFLLRPDCLARLTLPANLTQQDANRLAALVNALVMEEDLEKEDLDAWPFPVGADLEGDLDADDFDAGDDSDPFAETDDEFDEN